MRVIRGSARGMRLKSVPGDTTRPVTDRVKEALFNIFGTDIEGATFLDLFAGTGSIGIEALSCGADFVRFLDLHHPAIQTIRSNLEAVHLAARAQVLQKNAFTMLAAPPDRSFDYIYVAPPQFQDFWKQAIIAIDAQPNWLTDDAWVVAQIDVREYVALDLVTLKEFEQRRYGDTLLVFYQKDI